MTTGNRKARRAWAAAQRKFVRRGNLYLAEIEHDFDCGIYTPERTCTCNPNRILKDHNGRVLARVENAGFYDPFEFAGAS